MRHILICLIVLVGVPNNMTYTILIFFLCNHNYKYFHITTDKVDFHSKPASMVISHFMHKGILHKIIAKDLYTPKRASQRTHMLSFLNCRAIFRTHRNNVQTAQWPQTFSALQTQWDQWLRRLPSIKEKCMSNTMEPRRRHYQFK